MYRARKREEWGALENDFAEVKWCGAYSLRSRMPWCIGALM